MDAIDWDASGDDEQEAGLKIAHMQCELLHLKEQLQTSGREKAALKQDLINAATERLASSCFTEKGGVMHAARLEGRTITSAHCRGTEEQKLKRKLEGAQSERSELASRLKGVQKRVSHSTRQQAVRPYRGEVCGDRSSQSFPALNLFGLFGVK